MLPRWLKRLGGTCGEKKAPPPSGAEPSGEGADAGPGDRSVATEPPRHLGDIWHAIQEIAKEEDPRFENVSVVEHANASGEGLRDVNRWLEIYRRRLNPEHRYEFPAHYRRYRGHCMASRSWPDGLRWDAFSEETWFRAPLPSAPDEASLVKALDEHLRQA